MKSDKGWVVPVVLLLLSLFFLIAGVTESYFSGSTTNLKAVLLVGNEFTCEWVSTDGNRAILVSDSGKSRYVDVEGNHIEVGKRYRICSIPDLFSGDKLYLDKIDSRRKP